MKTAGVVFDFYDDPSGELVKTAFPTVKTLPESIKQAHILSSEERDVLRDEAFALIMSNEGKVLRKFACVDAGNTLLSCLYFEENAQRLPEEAVKVAALNLASFCNDFGFEPTDFVKMAAAGHSRTRDSMRQPIVGDEADWAARTNLVSIRGGGDSGRVIPTANQMKTAGLLNVYVVRQNEVPQEINLDSHHKLNPGSKPKDKKKVAEKMVDPGWWEAQKGIVRANRASDKGVGQFLANNELVGSRMKKGLGHGAVGGALGAAGGALIGHKVKGVGAGLGAALGGGAGSYGGLLHGQYKADKEHLKGKGIEMKMLGLGGARFTPEAAKKYLKKQSSALGGGAVLTDDKKDNGVKSKNPDLQKKSAPPADKNTFAVGQGQGDLEVNYKSLPKIATIVDVSGKTPVHKFEKKASSRHALNDTWYPLDSYADVKAAVAYFNDNQHMMMGCDRHEFAVKTASRAEELGIETGELLSRYGSTDYSPDLEAHIASRKAAAENFKEAYNVLLEKRAEVSPDAFVGLLMKVDEAAGLNWYYDGAVTDPYLATFGGKEKSANASWQWDGDERLTADKLAGLSNSEEFKNSFSSDITSEFAKDPVAIFDSMPAPTKAIMARLAIGEE